MIMKSAYIFKYNVNNKLIANKRLFRDTSDIRPPRTDISNM